MKLEVKNLNFSYGKEQILNDISFVASSGDFVAVLGINGVGKSTLLKCINKIIKTEEGHIFVDDVDIKNLKSNDLAKKIAYVSQTAQFGDVSLFDSVLLGRKPYIKFDVTKEDINIANEVIDMVNLTSLASRSVDKLSGGERQKASIARALCQQTPIMMFDEPTSNLDLKNQVEVLRILKELAEKKDYTILVTIHDINLALRYANKFLLMKDGKVYGYGDKNIITKETVKEVYNVSSRIIDDGTNKIVIVDE